MPLQGQGPASELQHQYCGTSCCQLGVKHVWCACGAGVCSVLCALWSFVYSCQAGVGRSVGVFMVAGAADQQQVLSSALWTASASCTAQQLSTTYVRL
jgi:hypothetical protein